jgi:hypothetical protein
MDGVCVVWVGPFDKHLEMVHRYPHLRIITTCDGRGMSPTGATSLTIVAVGRGALKVLLAPLFTTFDALLGAVGV